MRVLRLVGATLLFALVAPFFVLGLALTPIAHLRAACYSLCAFASRCWLWARMEPQGWKEESKIAGFLRRARRARRHARVVRP